MDDFIAYHGLQGRRPRGFSFGGLDTHPEGIHLGSLEQARMRAGSGAVLKVRVLASRLRHPIARVKDRDGGWRDTVRRRVRLGQQILVYLNRHEGLPIERVVPLAEHGMDKLARLPDRDFRRLAPEAVDSWIVLDPALIEVLASVPRPRARPGAVAPT